MLRVGHLQGRYTFARRGHSFCKAELSEQEDLSVRHRCSHFTPQTKQLPVMYTRERCLVITH